MLLKRRDIIEKLNSVNNNFLSIEELKDWAESVYIGDTEFEDWEEDHSVSNEVMSALDSLSVNLFIREDIGAYIKFLSTPYGKFDEGYRKWNDYLQSINYKERKILLKNIPLYTKYL